MKKSLCYFFIFNILFLFVSCQNTSTQENSSVLHSSATESNSESSKTKNQIELDNVITALTQQQSDQIHSLMNREEWKNQNVPERCISVDFVFRTENGCVLTFYEKGSVIVSQTGEASSCYSISEEASEKLLNFAVQATNEGIKNGNESLNKQIGNFNGLLLGTTEILYDIPAEQIYTLSQEEQTELRSLLNLEMWKLYTDSFEAVYNDENIPFTLHQSYQGVDLLLQIKQYGERYIVKRRSYDGSTDQDTIFEIPKETYENLLAWKKSCFYRNHDLICMILLHLTQYKMQQGIRQTVTSPHQSQFNPNPICKRSTFLLTPPV